MERLRGAVEKFEREGLGEERCVAKMGVGA